MDSRWNQVPELAQKLAEFCHPPAVGVRVLLQDQLTWNPTGWWYLPEQQKLAADLTQATESEAARLTECVSALGLPIERCGPEGPPELAVKVAYSPFLRTMAEALQFLPSKGILPNYPSPVTSMLATGLLGAGVGYGAGTWLGRHLPDSWNRKRLRRTLALAGGLLGALPGAVWAGVNLANDKSVLEGWPFNVEPKEIAPNLPDSPLPPTLESPEVKLASEFREYLKTAKLDPEYGGTGLGDIPPVNIDSAGRTLWFDPVLVNQVPPGIRGAAMSALHVAEKMPGGVAPGWVTPRQLGNLAAGMGSGYITGALVGGLLGALFGAPPETKRTLANTGMFAGLLNSAIPMLFGGSGD